MSTVNSLLVPGATELHGHVNNWRDAIRLAGGLLEKAGTITGEYTQSMIDSVERNGPYIVVAPGFAFAHARPSSAVKETSLSWVRLDSPVEFFHTKNDPVTLVVALAAVDSTEHIDAMSELAGLLGKEEFRARLEAAESEEELREVLAGAAQGRATSRTAATPRAVEATQNANDAADTVRTEDAEAVASKGKILTVCGNGLGTSLFLKNTMEKVLDAWGWAPFITVEATDTISAKGRAQEADFLLTSGEIAATLGDVGVPVYVVNDFTSEAEVDRALRGLYAVK